jgi:hypothetical protein
MTTSELQRRRQRLREVLFALAGALSIVLMLIVTIIAIPYLDGSSGTATILLPPSTEPLPEPTATSSSTTSTSTPGPYEVVIVTPEPPYKAPRPDPTPFPTCPADGSGVDCFFTPTTPTPPPFPTQTPLATCNDLRTAEASGTPVEAGWCREV